MNNNVLLRTLIWKPDSKRHISRTVDNLDKENVTFYFQTTYGPLRGMRTTKTQASLRTSAVRSAHFSLLSGNYHLSYDVVSGSEITPGNKIDKPLVVYRFMGNVMTSITTLRT